MFTRKWFKADKAEISEGLMAINLKMQLHCDIAISDEKECENIYEVYKKVGAECKSMWFYRRDVVTQFQGQILSILTPVYSHEAKEIKGMQLQVPAGLSGRGLTSDVVTKLLYDAKSQEEVQVKAAEEKAKAKAEAAQEAPDKIAEAIVKAGKEAKDDFARVPNGMAIMLAEEIQFLGVVKSTTVEALENSDVNDQRIYEPIPGDHTYQQDGAWMLAHFHQGREKVFVWDDITPQTILRTSPLHERELSGFAREIATAIKYGYELKSINVDSEEAKHGAKYVMKYNGKPGALVDLTLYDVLMKDEETITILKKIAKVLPHEKDLMSVLEGKERGVKLCQFRAPVPQVIHLPTSIAPSSSSALSASAADSSRGVNTAFEFNPNKSNALAITQKSRQDAPKKEEKATDRSSSSVPKLGTKRKEPEPDQDEKKRDKQKEEKRQGKGDERDKSKAQTTSFGSESTTKHVAPRFSDADIFSKLGVTGTETLVDGAEKEIVKKAKVEEKEEEGKSEENKDKKKNKIKEEGAQQSSTETSLRLSDAGNSGGVVKNTTLSS